MQTFILTIICCVAITLALALYSGRNIKTADEYITGSITFSPLMLCLTIIATLIASGDFALPNYIANYGIVNIIVSFGFAVLLLLVGRFIATKMVFFNDCYTPGDIMHKLYGKTGRMITAFSGCLFSLILITNQLRAIKYLNAQLLGMNPTALILLVGISVIVYTAIGGMQGVIKTDALQFCMVFLVLFIITRLLIAKIGGFEPLFRQIPSDKLALFNKKTTLWSRLESMFFWPSVYVLSLPILMRVLLIPRNKEQVKKTFYFATSFYLLISAMIIIIGLGALVYFQKSPLQLKEALSAKSLLGYLAQDLFSHSKLIQAFLFLGILFALASTLDSYVHAVGVEAFITFSHLSKSFQPLTRLENNRASVKALPYIRLITLLIGALAFIIVLTGIDLPFRFYGDTVVLGNLILLPLIVGILGFKTDKKSLLVFCISYIVTFGLTYPFIGWYVKGTIFRYKPFWLAMGIASTLYFITHYIVNNGFVIVQRSQQTKHYYHRTPSWQGFVNTLKAWLPTPNKLARIAHENVKAHGRNPLLFTIFIIGFWIFTSYDSTKDTMEIASFYTLLQGMGLALCVLTMALSRSKNHPYYSLLWFITVGYCIPYATTLTYLSDIKNASSIYSLLVAFIILLTCVNWRAFFTLSILGISAALMTYRLFSGQFFPVMAFETAWHLALVLLSVSIAAFFFTRKAEKHSFTQLQTTKLLGGSIGHETRNYLQIGSIVGNFITSAIKEKQIEPLKNIPESKSKQGYFINEDTLQTLEFMGKELVENSKKASHTLVLFTQAMQDKPLVNQLKQPNTSIKKLVQEAMQDAYFKQKNVSQAIQLDLKDDFMQPIHKDTLKHILINMVKNAIDHGQATKVQIALNKSTDSLHIRDNGAGIAPEKLPYIFDLFYSRKDSSGIGLALVKHLVNSFGGTIQCTSQQGKTPYTVFTITFP